MLREAAEYPNSFVGLEPGQERLLLARGPRPDDEPYAAALVLSEERGHGAYRALIRARWEHAVASGTPALLTQAGSMSRPILERLGFRRVGHLQLLVDEFRAGAEQAPGAESPPP